MKNISKDALAIIKKMQQNELNESIIYKKIAKFAKGEENKKTLERLANEERAHYEIWKNYTNIEMKPKKAKVLKYTLIARILGFTFAVKLMERGEEIAQEKYEQITKEVPESVHIREQEEEHEAALLDILDEEKLHYVGSMVLGLSDALVELAGSLAGFTFALQNTKLVALSGLIVGISATFSMASSEFLSAKSEGRNDAFKSCSYTFLKSHCCTCGYDWHNRFNNRRIYLLYIGSTGFEILIPFPRNGGNQHWRCRYLLWCRYSCKTTSWR